MKKWARKHRARGKRRRPVVVQRRLGGFAIFLQSAEISGRDLSSTAEHSARSPVSLPPLSPPSTVTIQLQAVVYFKVSDELEVLCSGLSSTLQHRAAA